MIVVTYAWHRGPAPMPTYGYPMVGSWALERPSDRRLERIYVADISATPGDRRDVAMGVLSQPLRLAIELSSTETFPLAGSIVEGFCREK